MNHVVSPVHLHPDDRQLGRWLLRQVGSAAPLHTAAALFQRDSDFTITAAAISAEPALCPALGELAQELKGWPCIWWLEGALASMPHLGFYIEGPLELQNTVAERIALYELRNPSSEALLAWSKFRSSRPLDWIQ